MASKSVIEERGLKKKAKYIEGVEKWVEIKGPVSNIINRLVDGLQSAMSYLACDSIKELQDGVKFYRVSSNGVRESYPNILLS